MLVQVLNRILTRLKGSSYVIDPHIPVGYLVRLSFQRMVMLLRGKMSFIQHSGLFFIGKNTTIRAKKLISVGSGVSIDDQCYVDALSRNGIALGNNVSLGKRTVIECTGSIKNLGHGLRTGDNVGLGRDCFYGCAGGVIIGSGTIIGNFVSFHSENHNIADKEVEIRLQGVSHKGIVIGKDCWIGAKATILDGAIIGDGCVIAAGAVVGSGVYDSYKVYGGIPAKKMKDR